jgi:amino acid permease
MSPEGECARRPIAGRPCLIEPSSLKSRHVQFIAIGGTIGTGLFLGIGKALTQAGPLSLFLGYTFTGVAVYAMVRAPCVFSPLQSWAGR